MYTDSAYLYTRLSMEKDKSKPLIVTSCGVYKLIKRPVLPTFRPKGRLDYQILYIASGKAHFFIEGKEQVLSSGHMVIYHPKEEQRYYYYIEESPEVYWLHFTGYDVKNILKTFGIDSKTHILSVGNHLEYKQFFLRIIQELSMRKYGFSEVTIKYFELLMILIHRNMEESFTSFHPFTYMDEMNQAVSYFHEHYQEEISIIDYAKKQNMSVSYFIKNFKEYTGTTPNKYLISLRMKNAESLLQETDDTITEIAATLGYDNPLYFSRIFTHYIGCSPKEFRNRKRPGLLSKNNEK